MYESYVDLSSYIQEKLAHPGIQKHIKNIGWMFFARIGTIAITFLATAYMARNLGPANYGELSYAISFVSLFAFIAYLGIDPILHRELIKNPSRRNELLGSAVALRLIGAILTILVTLLTALFVSSKDVSLFLIFIISLSSFFGAFQLLGFEFQAEAKSKYPSLLLLGVVTVLNLLKILTIYLGQGVIYLAFIVLLEPLLYSLGYLYLKAKVYKDVFLLRFKKEVMLSLLKDSYPLIFASAFFLIYSRIDQVMLKHMINAEAVGLYDSAVRITELSYFIPQIMLLALLPAIVNAKSVSKELYHRRTRKLFLGILGMSVVTALCITLLGEKILLVIFGAAFLPALPALYICAWSTVGAALNSLSQQVLIVENATKVLSVVAFFGMIANVLLNLLLIPIYGISGAALATLISYVVPFLSLFLFKGARETFLLILKA